MRFGDGAPDDAGEGFVWGVNVARNEASKEPVGRDLLRLCDSGKELMVWEWDSGGLRGLGELDDMLLLLLLLLLLVFAGLEEGMVCWDTDLNINAGRSSLSCFLLSQGACGFGIAYPPLLVADV